MVLLAFTGAIGSGKSTAAQYLVDMYNYTSYSFAEPLKRGIATMFGLDWKYVDGTQADKSQVHPRWNISGRQLLQVIGTDVFRDFVPSLLPQLKNIWIKRMEYTLEDTASAPCIVIPDCRFADEAEMVHRRGGKVIRIIRAAAATAPTHRRLSVRLSIRRLAEVVASILLKIAAVCSKWAAICSKWAATSHSSETQIIEADYTIINNGSIDELLFKVATVAAAAAADDNDDDAADDNDAVGDDAAGIPIFVPIFGDIEYVWTHSYTCGIPYKPYTCRRSLIQHYKVR